MKEIKYPAFRFYAKDWLSSANILLMTPAEEGAYIRLLAYCWDDKDCSLPDDDQALGLLSRLGSDFKKSSKKIKASFKKHPTKIGYLTNEKLIEQIKINKAWRKKCSEGGKKGSKIRWQTDVEEL